MTKRIFSFSLSAMAMQNGISLPEVSQLGKLVSVPIEPGESTAKGNSAAEVLRKLHYRLKEGMHEGRSPKNGIKCTVYVERGDDRIRVQVIIHNDEVLTNPEDMGLFNLNLKDNPEVQSRNSRNRMHVISEFDLGVMGMKSRLQIKLRDLAENGIRVSAAQPQFIIPGVKLQQPSFAACNISK